MSPQQIQAALLRSSPTLTGYITKRGGVSMGIDRFKTWKKRYFILYGGTLAYYKNEEEAANVTSKNAEIDVKDCRPAISGTMPGFSSPLAKPKGYLSLEGSRIDNASVTDSGFQDAPAVLVTTPERSEVIVFESEPQRDEWSAAINGAIDSMKKYTRENFLVLPDPPISKKIPAYVKLESAGDSPRRAYGMGIPSVASASSMSADSYAHESGRSVGRSSLGSFRTLPEEMTIDEENE